MSSFHLFTYGTLMAREDGPGRDLLRDCERVGEAVVRGTLYDAGDYPALVLDGMGTVAGTIWRCPAGLLPRLDHYEGVAHGLFRRVGIRIDDVACWVYAAGPGLGEHLGPDSRLAPDA